MRLDFASPGPVISRPRQLL